MAPAVRLHRSVSAAVRTTGPDGSTVRSTPAQAHPAVTAFALWSVEALAGR